MDYEKKANWLPMIGMITSMVLLFLGLVVSIYFDTYLGEENDKKDVSHTFRVEGYVEKEIIGNFPEKTEIFSAWKNSIWRNSEKSINYKVSVFYHNGEIEEMEVKYTPKLLWEGGNGTNKIREERRIIKGNTTEKIVRYIKITSDGEVVEIEEIKGNTRTIFPKNISSIIGTDFYASWMLRLKDKANWTEIIKVKDNTSNILKIINVTYFVDGYEEIEGRENFKVIMNCSETLISNDVEKTQNYTKVLWIDAQRRILTKGETNTENAHIIMSIQ